MKGQTYKNWKLIVTIFNEKKVRNVLNQLSIQNKLFYSENNSYKFSLSEVFENCIDSIEGVDKNILLWTTCDVVFDDNFLENIIKNYSSNFCGTSHPHTVYKTVHDLETKKELRQLPSEGIDTIFFDGNLFLDKRNRKIIKDYKFVNWGIFEHFLVALGKLLSPTMVNLWGVTNISKISNDRTLNNESMNFLMESWNNNFPVLSNFLSANKISKNYIDLVYCHLQFKVIKKYKYIRKFLFFYIIYSYKYFIKIIKNMVPKTIKSYLKGKLQ
ncbi:MAG: hypothetical protein NTW35_03475 [Candidatus Nomurabacteria bacterium]|nr:hypothetical protein [Candidatus Nomurabacteria bacterium]